MHHALRRVLLAAALVSPWCGAAAATKIKIACTATSDCASAMIATYDGVFAKHGLDAEMTLIGINTNIPPAIASDSIQIGGPTSTVFLQAVDGGLDLVAISGASVMDPATAGLIAAVQKPGLTMSKPADFVGRKVGVPGIGAFLDVLFRKWLTEGGVDPAKVNYVEVTFPTQNDALKSGAVDAVLTAEPFTSRIVAANNGSVAAHYAAELHRTDPIIEYVATRAWAEKNPEAVKAFREAIAETAKIVNADHAKAAEAQARFTKMNVDLLKKNPPSVAKPELKADDFSWWIDVMKQQGMLQGQIDKAKLVLP
ncbi:MAG: ABC transporter substrate-binding protein [Pseudomonadota bacterium]|nr:ABC transporter substrate-binding protein [Pseudomonadota bacterium]